MSIKIKAVLLLAVFSLNIAIGFACSMGVDMCFNREQAGVKMAKTEHSHGHHGKKGTGCCCDEKQHKHGCCNDQVIKLQGQDKSLAAAVSVDAPAWGYLVSTYFSFDHDAAGNARISGMPMCFYYPPPPDIRVMIQSFQI